MTCDDVKHSLSAYMDGEVAPDGRIAIAGHLTSCSSCAAELGKLEEVRDLVRREIADMRPPESLRESVLLTVRRAGYMEGSPGWAGWKPWLAIAAGILVMVLGAAPFLVSAHYERRLIAEEVLSSHVRALATQDIDVVSSDRHTVKPWFNGKISFSPPVTDLAGDGFPLAGGRLDYIGDHTAAVLVYQRGRHRIDLFVWPAAGGGRPAGEFLRDGFQEVSWQKDGFTFTAISDVNLADLRGFAGLVQSKQN